jgi:DNA-binding beta-propeller fold protein YncE
MTAVRRLRTSVLVALVGVGIVAAAPPSAAVDLPTVQELTFGSAGTDPGELFEAGDVTLAPSGDIYVAETITNRISVFDAEGGFVSILATGLSFPTGIVLDDDGNLVVSQSDSIKVLSPEGDLLDTIGAPGSGDGEVVSPQDVALDATGEVYVADTGNDRIQVFDADGDYLRQWGTTGDDDGQFDQPFGVTVGPDGDVYVADTVNSRIQVFEPDGTFLRGWTSDDKVGQGGVHDVEFDTDGNPIALINDHQLRSFTPTGTLRWSLPLGGSDLKGIAVGPDDRIYVSHHDHVEVLATPAMAVTLETTAEEVVAGADIDLTVTIENSGNLALTGIELTAGPPACLGEVDDLAPGESTQVECADTTTPADVGTLTTTVTVDAAETDPVTSAAVEVDVTASPVVVTLDGTVPSPTIGETVSYDLGISNDGTATLTGIGVEDALAPDCGGPVADLAAGATTTVSCTTVPDLFDLGEFGDLTNVATVFSDQAPPAVATHVLGFAPPPEPDLVRAWGTAGTGDGQFDDPTGVAIAPDGDSYVVDSGNDRVQRFDPDGAFVSAWGTTGSGNGQFDEPFGVVVGADGDVFVVDSGNDRVQRFDPDGTFVSTFGTPGSGNGQFSAPSDIDVTSAGNLVVTDSLNSRVQELTPTGTFVRAWSAGFAAVGVATGQGDDVYVTRSLVEDVRRFEPDGSAPRTLAPPPGGFDLPVAVDADPLGNVYVLNTGLGRVERFTPTDVQDLQFGTAGSGDGELDHPSGIAVDNGGRRILVADTGNDRVLELAFQPNLDVTIDLTADQAAVGVGDDIDFHLTITNTGNVTLTGVTAGFGTECSVPVGDLAPFASSVTDCTHVATVADADAGQFSLLGFLLSDNTGINGPTVTVPVTHVRRPDALVRLGNGAFAGGNRYNATGAQQARSTAVANRGTARFTLRAENDGTGTEDLRVRGQAGTNRYTVTYKRGAANVTNQVVAGTFRFQDVPAGANRTLTVIVTARNGTPRNAAVTRTVTVTSDSTPAVKDVVKVTVRRR